MTTEELPLCADCGQKMRPHNTRAADYPDTVARANSSSCQSCIQRDRRNLYREYRRRGHPDRIDDHIIPHLTPGFRTYLTRRRRRGVPAEGHPTAA
jgi:hypothetical protein